MARRGLWLAAPLAAFLAVFFVVPIAWLLSLAVREAEVPRALPRTLVALAGWRAPQPPGFYATVCQLYAKSRGRVTLRSADPAAPPRVVLNLFTHPDDLAQMRRAVRLARQLYAQAPQAGLVGDELLPGAQFQTDEELDTAIRAQGGITHHPVGTCAMGVHAGAVVDPALRVHGIAGLRVADASVMPTIVGANTNAATVMIGEKAADLVLGRRLPAAEEGVTA